MHVFEMIVCIVEIFSVSVVVGIWIKAR